MLKKFINNKGKEWFGADKSPNQVNSAQSGSKKDQLTSPSLGTIEQKPFKINLNELWQYDYEELSDFIPQYEEYITFLRQKCHEAMERYFAAEEQIEQLKQEKSVPTDRVDRTRQQTVELLDAFTPTAMSPSFTKERPEFELKHLEEVIAEKMKFCYVDDNLLSNLKETASKAVEQLAEIRNILFSNTSQIPGTHLQENNGENPDYFDLLSDNQNQNVNQASAADNFVDFKIRETTRDEVINLIGDIEMTAQLVFPKFIDINNKLKAQEKILVKEINQALSNMKKPKSESINELMSPEISQVSRVSEGEVAEIRTQLDTTKSKLIEVEKRNHGLSIQLVDSTAREESYKLEFKNLNAKIGDLEKKIKEGDNNLKKADNNIKDGTNKLQQADTKYKQLETKAKELEGKIKEGEKTKKEMENKLKETENKTNELEAKLGESENKYKDTVVKLKNMQDQKEEVANQFTWLKKEHQNLISSKEKVEGETGEEVTKLQERVFFLENDNERLKDKAIEAELSKTDLENKVIQERLKHHQTIVDMQKLNETLKEAEKHLDDEVEAHKAVVHKSESLKKKIAENDKKIIDYKKTIKRLSQQVLDLHNKINDSNKRAVVVSPVNVLPVEKIDEIEEFENNNENLLGSLQVEDLDHALKEKNQLISQQTDKIQALLVKLEEALQESLARKKDNEELKKEKETLRSQNKVLQDKRESGLLEIQRLNNAIDKLKEKYPDIGSSLVQPIIPKGLADKIGSPTKIEEPIQSPPLVKGNSLASPIETSQKKPHQPSRSISIVTSPQSRSSMPGSSQMNNIRKNLDALYKEVILALTSEKLNAKKQGSNTAGSPGEKSLEEELGESLVKIEKKVNDVMLLLQDYIEVVSRAWKNEM